MNKISKKLKELNAKKEGALIVGTVPGYPDIKTSFLIIKKIINSGADILELSSSTLNPTVDGLTLKNAHKKVLDAGYTKEQIFNLYKKITTHFNIPIFVVEYSSEIYKIGLEKYFKRIKKCKIDTLIIPDISLEEIKPFYKFSLKNNINLSLIITQKSSDKRIKFVVENSEIFVYCTLVAGVTGTRKKINTNNLKFIKHAKEMIKLPLIVGFGISQPKHIKVLSKYKINGFVTCSKIIDLINKNLSSEKNIINDLELYVKSMKSTTIFISKKSKFKIKNKAREFWR
jgi:tryptophan synthase alpha chain